MLSIKLKGFSVFLFSLFFQFQAVAQHSVSYGILKEYSKGTQQYRAAEFLLKGISEKYTLEGETIKNFDCIFQILDSIQKNRVIKNQDDVFQQKWDSLNEEYGSPVEGAFQIIPDTVGLSKQQFLSNLNWSFIVKQEKSWLKDIPQHIFNEYILPYRVAAERLDTGGRAYLYNIFNNIKKSNKARQEAFEKAKSSDMLTFASDVEYEIRRRVSTNATMWAYPFDIPIIKMDKGKQGACRHLVNYTTAAMRSVGLPVASDFTLRWGNNRTGHKWNVLFLPGEKEMSFDACSFPFSFNIPDRKIVKIYREQYSKENDFIQPIEEDVPAYLFNSCWKDVTKNYTKVTDVKLPVPEEIASRKSFVLIGTFDNSEWQPQFYAKVVNGKAIFKDMGVNNVYIAMVYNDGACYTFNDPFKVDSTGRISFITVNADKCNLSLTRKFPRNSWIKDYEESMKEAKVECSNDSMFQENKLVFKITETPDSLVTVHCKLDKFRYFRYVFPDTGKVYLGELSFYNDGKKIPALPININGNSGLEKVSDNNLNTYYWGKSGQTILYDFGQPVSISTVKYAPRSDTNFIMEGNEYQLCYWKDGKWVIHETIVATSSSITSNNAPSNGLYLLRNLTRGNEERIFTYENGAQVWW